MFAKILHLCEDVTDLISNKAKVQLLEEHPDFWSMPLSELYPFFAKHPNYFKSSFMYEDEIDLFVPGIKSTDLGVFIRRHQRKENRLCYTTKT